MTSDTYDVFGVQVSKVTPRLAVERILNMIEQGEQGYVCCAPASTIADCQRDSQYKEILNQAAMVTPDGKPVAAIGRKAGYEVHRTPGPDLMADLCREKNLCHYFYGGTPENNELLIAQLRKNNSDIQIAGSHAPGLMKIGQKEVDEVLGDINQACPDILWVGLGAPKQDYWMALHQRQLDVPVMIGVGAAFDFLSGVRSKAPKWMQASGLEWLYRLGLEPRRLWKRYLVGNTVFLYLLLKQQAKAVLRMV